MVTGFIYAALFYVATLLLAAIGGVLAFPGDEIKAFSFFKIAATIVGPLIIAPLGFVFGFFREQRKMRRLAEAQAAEERERARQTAALRMEKQKTQMQPTQPQVEGQPTTAPAEGNVPAPPNDGDGTQPPQGQPEGEAVGAEAPRGKEGMSDEVKEYLKQTSRVDLKGIKDFIEETRRHRLEDLEGGEEEPSSSS